MRLKYNEVKPLREKLLQEQTGCCALCAQPVVNDAVLDHCHKTGVIRGVLHRGCNALLGKIENNMPRNRVDMGQLAKIAENLIKYLVADPKSEFLHPTHKTKEERNEKLASKRKQKREQKKRQNKAS